MSTLIHYAPKRYYWTYSFMLQLYRHWDTTEFFSHSIRKLLGYIRTNRTNNPNIFELSVKNEKKYTFGALPAISSATSIWISINATVCSRISSEYKLRVFAS